MNISPLQPRSVLRAEACHTPSHSESSRLSRESCESNCALEGLTANTKPVVSSLLASISTQIRSLGVSWSFRENAPRTLSGSSRKSKAM